MSAGRRGEEAMLIGRAGLAAGPRFPGSHSAAVQAAGAPNGFHNPESPELKFWRQLTDPPTHTILIQESLVGGDEGQCHSVTLRTLRLPGERPTQYPRVMRLQEGYLQPQP